jgi:hypothetical protein
VAPLNNQDRILQEIRLSSVALDDDQLSQRSGITPRQTVNQICRALTEAGILRRPTGPDGKKVNELVSRHDGSQPSVSADSAVSVDPDFGSAVLERFVDHTRPPGSSTEQREAERVMLDLLAAKVGVTFEPARLTVPAGSRVEIDGADAARTILVECWAHQGKPKTAQRHKVLADALKLTWIASTIYPRPRLILCMSDPLAAAPFLPTSRAWAARALQDLGITVVVVELPEGVRKGIQAAQERQYR